MHKLSSLSVIALILVAPFVISSCGPSAEPESNSAPKDSKGSTAATTKLTKSDSIEVVAFKGGYGIDFYEKAAKEFGEKNKDYKISVAGDARVWEKLRPRFVGGNPPDLAFPGWGLDHWALAEEDQILQLDDILKTKAFGSDQNWGDTFEPSLLKLGQLEGKQYTLPFYMSLVGWWYDPGVFKKNGWTPPKTYDELLVLCEKIKAKGIAPLTYQGQYPYYMLDGMLLPWTVSIGGAEALAAMQNLEPGAWKSPAVLQAAKMIKELQTKGYFQKGATAMSHTESQQEFLQGKAAMISCGTWLYSEMKDVMPKEAQMEFFMPPVVANGKGEPTSLQVAVEPWMIPSKGKNQEGAVEFFKYMTSVDKAKEFVKAKGTLMAIKGSAEGDVPEILKAPAAAFKASKNVWSIQFRHWYPAFEKEIENALTGMLNGELTPEAFVDRVEAGAEKTRKDPNVTKHKL